MTRSKAIRCFLIVLLLSSVITGCQYSFLNLEYQRGQAALENKQYKKAVGFFRRVIKRTPDSKLAVDAALKAADISVFKTKDYPLAISLYEHVVLFSKDEGERRTAQLNIAKIYFEKLANYKLALKTYNKLLSLSHTKEEEAVYRMAAARSNFYLSDYFQSQIEIERLLKTELSNQTEFQARLFLGNIFFTVKKMDLAIKVFKGLIEKFPAWSEKEKVAMSIVVCYEELKDYDLAIKKLEELKLTHPSPEILEIKIQRLKKRKSNLPGYKGLRK